MPHDPLQAVLQIVDKHVRPLTSPHSPPRRRYARGRCCCWCVALKAAADGESAGTTVAMG